MLSREMEWVGEWRLGPLSMVSMVPPPDVRPPDVTRALPRPPEEGAARCQDRAE